MEEDTDQNQQLHGKYIRKKLDACYEYIRETKGHDVLLVLGNTGVGKSTTCNYLFGHRMKEEKFNGRPVIETVYETHIKIGHEVTAETLNAQTILVHGVTSLYSRNDYCLCLLDCPGFSRDRTFGDRVIESMSTELAIRNAHQIKGILILISLNIILETRARELYDLVETLISLFKDPVEMVQYSVFVITKKYKLMPDSEARELTIGALNSLIDYCQKQATKLHENQNLTSSERQLTYIDFDKIATYFSAIRERHSNIVFINPLDNGESRKLIFDKIHDIKRSRYLTEFSKTRITEAKKSVGIGTNQDHQIGPIDIDDFNFSVNDEIHIKFYETLYERAHNGYLLINKIRGYGETSLNLYSEISNHQARLIMWKQLQFNLGEVASRIEEDGCQYSIDFQSIKNIESTSFKNEERIRIVEAEINRIAELKEKLNDELQCINSDSPLIFMKKLIDKGVSSGRKFSWEQLKFNANTGLSSTQILKVCREMENGCWICEDDRRCQGIYKVTYQSDYQVRPARASVAAYIQTKDEAGNRIRREEINNKIFELSTKEEKLKSEIDDLMSENKSLLSIVEHTQAKPCKEDYKNNLRQKLAECEKAIQHHSCLIIKIQQNKEARVAGLTSLQEFHENQREFDIICDIAAMLEFPSSLIQQFVSQYREFLSDLRSYSCIFDQINISLDDLPCRKDNKEVLDLKDPITGVKMKDLVIIPAGILFDEHSVFKQFDTSKGSVSPFVFKQKDGFIEEIKYLSWVPYIESYPVDKQQKLYSQASSVSFSTKSDISQMTVDQLKELRDGLLQKTRVMQEQLEANQTEIDNICQQLRKLQPDTEFKQNLLLFNSQSETSQMPVDLLEEHTLASREDPYSTKTKKFEPKSLTSVAEKATSLNSLTSLKCHQQVQTTNVPDSCISTYQHNQETQTPSIPIDKGLSLNNLSSNLYHEDSLTSDSILGFNVIPQNFDINIDCLVNKDCSDMGSFTKISNKTESVKRFASMETVSSDTCISTVNEMSDEDKCVCTCPCGRIKTTVTYPCKHFYFCEKCAPITFELDHRCPVCKKRIKSYDKIF